MLCQCSIYTKSVAYFYIERLLICISIIKTLGKIGRIAHIYPDKDLKIELCGTTWTYSPLAVTKLPSQSARSIPASCELSNGDKPTDSGSHVSPDKLTEALVKVAANGDATKCEQLLRMPGSSVNGIFAGHTALQAAAQNGHVHVIRVLIKHGVDPEIADKDGDRAIHHAAFGNEPGVIELLATATKCDLNARNKRRQTALHIGVNKVHPNVVQVRAVQLIFLIVIAIRLESC